MTDITELAQMKGQKVEGSYYLAECTDCGKMYPSNKLNGGEPLFSGDYGECYCPHCNADDADVADWGAHGSDVVTAWNYQQDRIDALVEALEKSEKTSEARREAIDRTHNMFVRERDRANAAEEVLEKAQRTQTCEHSMFWDASGVKRCSKCDLPEHANVHYADAAEMEIAALRQRIAELEESNAQVIQSRDHYKRMTEEGLKQLAECRTVTVKLPKPHAHLIWIQAGHAPDDFWDDVAVSHSEKDRCCDGSERYPVYARWEIEEMLTAAGVDVREAE